MILLKDEINKLLNELDGTYKLKDYDISRGDYVENELCLKLESAFMPKQKVFKWEMLT